MFYRVLIMSLFIVSSMLCNDNFTNIQSFQANFKQIIKNQNNKTIEYEGKIFIKSSGKVLWKYQKPIVKNVYVIDNVVIIDEPELEQVIYTNLEKDINILKLLKQAKKVDKNLYKTVINKTEYFISLNNNKIESLSYKDELSNNIKIYFSNSTQNKDIDDSIFRFLPPEYYDIIRK